MVEPKNDTLRATAFVGRLAAVGLAGVTGAPGRGVEGELVKLPGDGLLVNMVPPCFDPELGFSRQRATYNYFRRLAETEAILINRAVVRFENCPSEQVAQKGNAIQTARAEREPNNAPPIAIYNVKIILRWN